jgi:hypothetical protein
MTSESVLGTPTALRITPAVAALSSLSDMVAVSPLLIFGGAAVLTIASELVADGRVGGSGGFSAMSATTNLTATARRKITESWGTIPI